MYDWLLLAEAEVDVGSLNCMCEMTNSDMLNFSHDSVLCPTWDTDNPGDLGTA